MIKNNSVKKLQSLKTISLSFVILGGLGFFITYLIAAIKSEAGDKAIFVLTLVIGTAAFFIIGAIVSIVFDYAINHRQENIDYMNARLDHLNGKKSKKEVK